MKMTPLPLRRARQSGSALLVSLGILAVTSVAVGAALLEARNRFRTSHHSGRWTQAAHAAEAGVEMALMSAQKSSWVADGWTAAPGAVGTAAVTKTFTLSTGVPATGPVAAKVAADQITVAGSAWLRIRSTGNADVSGGAVASQDAQDVLLRKLSLRRDRTTGASVGTTPRATRTVEILAKPQSMFPRAITLTNQITNNQAAVILDSFDSGDPAKSTGGVYDVAKRQSNARIGTLDSTGSDLNGMQVFGDLMYSGAAVADTYGVTGQVITPFAETLPPVPKPTWATVTGNYGSVTGAMNLPSGPPGSPTRYKMSGIQMNDGAVTLTPPAAGQPGEIEIWITGDIKMSGTAQLISQLGVKAKVYIEGNVAVSGQSMANQSMVAANFTIFGVTPTDGSLREWRATGLSDFTAGLYAPSFNINLGGNGAYTGAFVGKTLNIAGNNAAIHYDEALSRAGGGSTYKVASWVEAVR